MTKKDYVLIAAALKEAREQIPATGEHSVWEYVANATAARVLAYALASDNPRFDRAKFLAACDLTAAE